MINIVLKVYHEAKYNILIILLLICVYTTHIIYMCEIYELECGMIRCKVDKREYGG